MTKIKIDSVEQSSVEFGIKFTLISERNKYSFFNTKKDGSDTKAYEQFKKYGFGVGDTVEAEVKEEQRSFTNKDGENIDYTQRTIIYFKEVENTPIVQKSTERNVWDAIKALEDRLDKLDKLEGAPKVSTVSQEEVKPEDVFRE